MCNLSFQELNNTHQSHRFMDNSSFILSLNMAMNEMDCVLDLEFTV